MDVNALIADRARWVKGHPADDGAWAVLGAAYLEQARRTADAGHYPQAEAALKRSLALRPAEKGNFDAMVGMGALANARHDFVTARKWGELVRAQAPRNWTAYPVLIDAYSGLGAYKPAEAAMEKLVALRGGLPGFLRASQVYRDAAGARTRRPRWSVRRGPHGPRRRRRTACTGSASWRGSGARRRTRCARTRGRCAPIRRRGWRWAAGPGRWRR